MLIHGYEQWGLEGLLRRIRGMYAFAIVDLAPGGRSFTWPAIRWARSRCSSAGPTGSWRSPLRHGPWSRRWTPRRRSTRLRSMPCCGTATSPARGPFSPAWRSFRPVMPGAWAATARRGEYRHWQPDFFHPEEGVAEDVWLDRVEEALTTAVRRRFVADVPVGVMLSGGVDSSLVTAIAAKTMGAVKTFLRGQRRSCRRRERLRPGRRPPLPHRPPCAAGAEQRAGEPAATGGGHGRAAGRRLGRQPAGHFATGAAVGHRGAYRRRRRRGLRRLHRVLGAAPGRAPARWLPAISCRRCGRPLRWPASAGGELTAGGDVLGMVVYPLEDTLAAFRRADWPHCETRSTRRSSTPP